MFLFIVSFVQYCSEFSFSMRWLLIITYDDSIHFKFMSYSQVKSPGFQTVQSPAAILKGIWMQWMMLLRVWSELLEYVALTEAAAGFIVDVIIWTRWLTAQRMAFPCALLSEVSFNLISTPPSRQLPNRNTASSGNITVCMGQCICCSKVTATFRGSK